jgi:hypothetical protein
MRRPAFGVGNNVIAGSQFFGGPDFAIADNDIFSFVVPENSVLRFVSVAPLALLGFGLLALFVRRAGARSLSLPS